MKQFFPDVSYNKKKLTNYFLLLALGVILIGGLAAMFFILNQQTIGFLVLVFVVIALSTIPSALTNYPLKRKPLIEVNGARVKLYGKEEFKASEILAVSVCIEVPAIKKTKAENEAFLKEIASKKPDEQMLGTCDILVKDAKGKEETKYNIVDDAIGALDALLIAGVKKYRIVYCMKKMTCPAGYTMKSTPNKDQEYAELSEKDRMMQLM